MEDIIVSTLSDLPELPKKLRKFVDKVARVVGFIPTRVAPDGFGGFTLYYGSAFLIRHDTSGPVLEWTMSWVFHADHSDTDQKLRSLRDMFVGVPLPPEPAFDGVALNDLLEQVKAVTFLTIMGRRWDRAKHHLGLSWLAAEQGVRTEAYLTAIQPLLGWINQHQTVCEALGLDAYFASVHIPDYDKDIVHLFVASGDEFEYSIDGGSEEDNICTSRETALLKLDEHIAELKRELQDAELTRRIGAISAKFTIEHRS